MEKPTNANKGFKGLKMLLKCEKFLATVKKQRCCVCCPLIVWLSHITLMTWFSSATVITIYWIIIFFSRCPICLQILSFKMMEPLHIIAEQYKFYWMKKPQIHGKHEEFRWIGKLPCLTLLPLPSSLKDLSNTTVLGLNALVLPS